MKLSEQRADLRNRPVEDLERRAREIDEQLFRLRVQKSMGQPEAGNKLRPLRRELARIKTLLREMGVRS